MAPGVGRRDRISLVVLGTRPDEPLALRTGQRMDSAVETLLRKLLGLARPRPEAGTPEQALGLTRPEAALDRQECFARQKTTGIPAVFIGKNPV